MKRVDYEEKLLAIIVIHVTPLYQTYSSKV